MEFEQVMMSRKSCRSYLEKEVEEEKIEKVVTAGSLAPLGRIGDGRPHVTVVTDKEVLKKLGGLSGGERDLIYKAPVLAIVSCPSSWAGIPEMNAACVVEMMSLEATNLGLGNIYLYRVTAVLAKNREFSRQLGIPENYTPLSALAFGYGTEDVSVCKKFEKVLEENRI